MRHDKTSRHDGNVTGILATALVPLAGVLLLGWDLQGVMLVYWLENLLVGGFVVLRLYVQPPWTFGSIWARLLLLPFYVWPWLAFLMVQGLVILMLFDAAPPEEFYIPQWHELYALFMAYYLWLPLAVLLSVEGNRFARRWLLARGWRQRSMLRLLGGLYLRTIAVHVAVIVGAIGVLAMDQPLLLLLALIGVKLGLDLAALAVGRWLAAYSAAVAPGRAGQPNADPGQ